MDLDPFRSSTWYNLGLLYKYQKRWQESLQANLKAHELNPRHEAACWNSGIAATALHDWYNARSAWRKYGIDIDNGTGPIKADYGMVPIRLEIGEVVWAHRIDPARAVIKSIPLSNSGYLYGDVVLHDGAPNGYRVVKGKEIPVFDVLDLWQSSVYYTFKVKIIAEKQADYEKLEHLVYQYHDTEIEDWTSSIRILCKACSEGTPHEHSPDKEWASYREIAITLKEGHLIREILDGWTLGNARRVLESIEIQRNKSDIN